MIEGGLLPPDLKDDVRDTMQSLKSLAQRLMSSWRRRNRPPADRPAVPSPTFM